MENLNMVLFIDDEQQFLIQFLEALRLEGIRYEVMVNIRDAAHFLKTTDTTKISLVVLDVMMNSYDDILPGVDTQNGIQTGFYFLYEILKYIPAERVMILTNYAKDADFGAVTKATGVECRKKSIGATRFIDIVTRQYGVVPDGSPYDSDEEE
jgi:DNA-binding NarL/FixJ family response regulator